METVSWYNKDMNNLTEVNAPIKQIRVKKDPIKKHISTKKVSVKSMYDLGFVQAELRDMLETIRAHEDITSKAQLFKYKDYSQSRFYHWKSRFETNMRVQESIKKIEEIIEARLVERGLQGKAIPMTIFLLKNYYGYTDQYQHKVDETVTFKVTRGRAPIEAPLNIPNKQIKP